jgi:hypothetical protein
MVHALHETWRVTQSAVVDIRPLALSPLVFVRERNGGDIFCGELQWCDESGQHHIQSDTALARVLSDNKLVVVKEDRFDWYDTFETADALVEQVHDDWLTWTVDEDTALKLMRAMKESGRGATAFIKQGIGVRMLKIMKDETHPS